MNIAKNIFRGDKGIWAIFFLLCIISMLEVFSSSIALSETHGIYWTPIIKHFILLIAGVFIVLVVHNIPHRFYSLGLALVPISFFLLVGVMIWGEQRGSAARWLKIFNFQFQPSELAKLSLIVSIAFLLGKMQDTKESKNNVFKVLMIGIIPLCSLIMFDNLSTAGLLFSVCMILMIIGEIPVFKIVKTLFFAAMIVVTIFFAKTLLSDDSKKNPEKEVNTELVESNTKGVSDRFRSPTWKSRIDRFADTWIYDKFPAKFFEDDKNLQSGYSRVAIARGGFSPKLPGNSHARIFLPEANSDFIYAIIVEELGVAGGILVIGLYVALLIRCGRLVQKGQHKFPAFLLIGCALIIFCQALMHIMVCVQLMPVTGQPLPLISKGGTSLWITCVYFGIMLGVSRTITPAEVEENEEITEEAEIIT